MKQLDDYQMLQIAGGALTHAKIAGCSMFGIAATWAAIASGPAALGIGLLTYGGCLLIES